MKSKNKIIENSSIKNSLVTKDKIGNKNKIMDSLNLDLNIKNSNLDNKKKKNLPFNKIPNNNDKNNDNYFSIENLNSINNQLEFLNLLIIRTFKIQKENTDLLLYERINEVSKLREYIFGLTSKYNNIVSISKIENYFNINNSKILSIQPKMNNIIENIDDLKANINYGMDRLYLEDNLVCDENSLISNLNYTVYNLEKLNLESQDKLIQIQEIKKNYLIYSKQLEEENQKLQKLKYLKEIFKKKVLDKNVKRIFELFVEKNNKIQEEIFNKKYE